jgi:hypothetical protein
MSRKASPKTPTWSHRACSTAAAKTRALAPMVSRSMKTTLISARPMGRQRWL